MEVVKNALGFGDSAEFAEADLLEPDTPSEFQLDMSDRRSPAPFYVAGGFVCLFAFLFTRGRAGRSKSYMFGEARVKAQMTAVSTLVGMGLYMGATSDGPKTARARYSE
mmetsp:Transcript_18402/g.36014  ORF Transcript_18402/g.36014 Transcript_18402/m.36014 type:complete len:109 (+) Transcript_18402:61-387(+)|eukprot:CAMPEP_0175138568 /NCGR_PEP_ID=MMETSP0087-20121206/10424_1 /TAXON_ID=136419 /ORGANISM="Unknown Unknown, Strain D1" /LENGTH=108 /DNA_ID=CAMNT_0016421491 /DNA_START=57 /DNA_END=383 /DNA_ORIENTATION=+